MKLGTIHAQPSTPPVPKFKVVDDVRYSVVSTDNPYSCTGCAAAGDEILCDKLNATPPVCGDWIYKECRPLVNLLGKLRRYSI